MKYEIKEMLKVGGGAIVNVSSIGGVIVPGPGYSVYATAKAGMLHLTHAAAYDYAFTEQGPVRVNCITPGAIFTRMFEQAKAESPIMHELVCSQIPMRRIGDAKEVADACVWLCSDRASYITGQVISVDGGRTL